MSPEYIPLEDEEQIAVVQWLELQGFRFTSIPNSTYAKSWRQKAHNTATGLRAGFPDIVVLIPPTRAVDGLGHLLCIEMKRRKLGKVSEEQRAWLAALNGLGLPGVDAVVAHGAGDAIEYITSYLKYVSDVEF